jgi:aspartyl-tRNA(Asn)/glutamyl-tRNA(Gln) amidotransferase subunit B
MLHTLVRWIGICDGNMQEGSLRFDANVSVRRPGAELGARREIKNLNSFRFLQQAIEYEAQWQIDTLEAGGKVQQATVLFDSDKCETRAMRSKEDAHDYRYFPDPDLLPVAIDADWIERVRKTLPELPLAKRARYVADLDLSAYDADTLTSSREMADLFEATLSEVPGEAKLCANWLMGDVSASLNREDRDVAHCPISPQQLGGVLKRIVDGTISNFAAKEVFKTLWSEGGDPDAIIEEKGLKQISDVGTLEAMIDKIIADNAAQVAEYRSGKEKVFGFFVGLAMKASKGSANPAQMQEILKRKLSNQK